MTIESRFARCKNRRKKYSEMMIDYVRQCATMLAERGKTISCAESATAGRFCSTLALMAESGKILLGGIVCYDAQVKTKLLGIPKEFLEEHTPESAEVTKALAEPLSRFFDSDVHLAVTGLVSPGGSETVEKPVGTIFIHAILNGRHVSVRQVFSGSPEQIILQAVNRGAECIVNALRDNS